MFHPLMPDLKDVKDVDLESKITELGKKYLIAAKSGNGYLCDQILVALEQYKDEQKRRFSEKNKQVTIKDQNRDLDDLIKTN